MAFEDVVDFHAFAFAKSTGIEVEELQQEGREAAYRAATDGNYDPYKASLRTHTSTCIYRHFCTVAERHKRKNPLTKEIDDAMPLYAPSPEDMAIFAEMLRQLPDDARLIVDMIFGQPDLVANIAKTKARQVIAETLKWPSRRLQVAFADISSMLNQYDAQEA